MSSAVSDGAASPTQVLPERLHAYIDEYDSWAKEQSRLEQEKDALTIPLYHYTTLTGLRGLIESQALWFADYRHLNDPGELSYGLRLVNKMANRLTEGADQPVRLLSTALSHLLSKPWLASIMYFYISSFSRNRDELGQWRAYAANGQGFALGLGSPAFKFGYRSSGEMLAGSQGLYPFTSSVIYSSEGNNYQIRAALEKLITIVLKAAEEQPEIFRNADAAGKFLGTLVAYFAGWPLIYNCLISKHPAYATEQEVRMLILGVKGQLSKYTLTRVRIHEIVPYIARPIDIRSPGNITEIVVGPAAPKDTERTLRVMLESLGIDPIFPITRSDIPYRAL